MLRDDLERLLEDVTLLTIGFAIALGWSLFQFARGVATFVDGLTTHLPPNDEGGFSFGSVGGGMTWQVGHHIVSLDGMLTGLIELLLVLAVAVYVRARITD